MPPTFPIVQFPSRPLIVTALAAAVARRTYGRPAAAARLVSQFALIVWSGQEIFEGANWFRRLLGVGGAAVGIAELARGRGRD